MSVFEGQFEQSEEKQAGIREYIEDQNRLIGARGQTSREGESFCTSIFLILPRLVGIAILLLLYILFFMFVLVYLSFWIIALILTLFRHLETQVKRLKRDLSTGFDGLSKLASALLWTKK